jgi:NitT/TauT family transport system substrate-binding protein
MSKKFLSWICVALIFTSLYLTACQSNTNDNPNESGSNASVTQSTDAGSDTSQDALVSSESSSTADASASTSVPTTSEPVDINVAALKGPTAMGLVKLMDDSAKKATDSNNYSFETYSAPDELTPLIIQGKVDIAAVPANLAAVLCNKTEGKVKVLAVNTLGVLYIVENGNTISKVEDLKGKTIYASGKGSTPEYALNYMLKANSIDPEKDVTIEYKSEHTECLSALANDKNCVAMLPQPFVTTAMMKNSNIRIAIDINAEWEKAARKDGSDAKLVTGVIIGRSEFVDAHKDAVSLFLKQYEKSINFTNENIDEASTLIENFDIIKKQVATKAIPLCNIKFVAGEDMKTMLSGYLGELYKQNPKSVGGKLPDGDFYYVEK